MPNSHRFICPHISWGIAGALLDDHPLEYHLWDAVLTFWLMGWVGWFPTYLFDQWWGAPLCCVGMLFPSLYVTWRGSAHRRHKLRCDWLDLRRS